MFRKESNILIIKIPNPLITIGILIKINSYYGTEPAGSITSIMTDAITKLSSAPLSN